MIPQFHGLDLDDKKVVISIEEVDDDCEYKLVLTEKTSGTCTEFISDFDLNESDVNWTLKADFLCFGRYLDFFALSFIVLICSYIKVM